MQWHKGGIQGVNLKRNLLSPGGLSYPFLGIFTARWNHSNMLERALVLFPEVFPLEMMLQ